MELDAGNLFGSGPRKHKSGSGETETRAREMLIESASVHQ